MWVMIRNRTKEEVRSFIDKANKEHKTTSFDLKISPKQIRFLGTMVYKDQQHKI